MANGSDDRGNSGDGGGCEETFMGRAAAAAAQVVSAAVQQRLRAAAASDRDEDGGGQDGVDDEMHADHGAGALQAAVPGGGGPGSRPRGGRGGRGGRVSAIAGMTMLAALRGKSDLNGGTTRLMACFGGDEEPVTQVRVPGSDEEPVAPATPTLILSSFLPPFYVISLNSILPPPSFSEFTPCRHSHASKAGRGWRLAA